MKGANGDDKFDDKRITRMPNPQFKKWDVFVGSEWIINNIFLANLPNGCGLMVIVLVDTLLLGIVSF